MWVRIVNSAVCEFILQHSLIILILYIMGGLLARTAVNAMLPPTETSSEWYGFFYRFMGGLLRMPMIAVVDKVLQGIRGAK